MSDNQLSELNQELEERKELVLATGPGDPSTLIVTDMIVETQQWVAYAYQKAQEGDVNEVGTALATVHEYLNQIANQSEMAGRVIAGLLDMVDTIAKARDEAEERAEDLECELEQVRYDQYDEAVQSVYESLDVDEIHEEVEGDFHESVEYIAQCLRRLGAADKADELEQAAGQRREALETSDNLLGEYRRLYYALVNKRPVAAPPPPITDEDDDDAESEDDL